MGLFVQSSSGQKGRDLAAFIAEDVSVIVLDIDDATYHFCTGLHAQIRTLIVADANSNSELETLRQEWASKKKIGADAKIAHEDLGWAFPLIVEQYRQKGPQALTTYLEQVYDADYSVIPPEPEFVAAVEKLRANGIRVVFYSNGPMGHIGKVLERVGFVPGAFTEDDIVDLTKTDRNPWLLPHFGFEASQAAEVFRKPTAEGFARMAATLGFEPGPDVVFCDDSLGSLEAVTRLDVVRVHIAPTEDEFLNSEAEAKRDYALWSLETDENGRYCSTVGILLTKVVALLPTPVVNASFHPTRHGLKK